MNAVKFNDHLMGWGAAVTAVLIAIPLAYAAVSEHVQTRRNIAALHAECDDQEQRVRVLERNVTEIRVDVKWIRQDAERKNDEPKTASN